jgi:hypothetical protein
MGSMLAVTSKGKSVSTFLYLIVEVTRYSHQQFATHLTANSKVVRVRIEDPRMNSSR